MDCRLFNTKMPAVNEEWAARVLGMSRNFGNGVDLYDGDKIVEVKFHLLVNPPKKRQTVCWKGFDYQVDYGKETGLPLYFLLGKYKLDRHIKDIDENVPYYRLEDFVENRNAWIVNAKWFGGFPTYRQIGDNGKRKWDNSLKFAYGHCLPRTYKSFDVEGGKINLTAGVERKYFENL